VALKDGDVISFKGPKCGCRAYLCFSGGIDVPVVMGSRSTYTRAKIGGYEGRALKAGDVLKTGAADAQWKNAGGFSLPQELRPDYKSDRPLKIITGLQQDAFTEAGLATLFGSEYTVTSESDRMGCRFEGPKIEHVKGADIVSDAIPLGAVQIPGHGMPIAMLADRQTTGGYTKVGVLTQASIQALVQKIPGAKVRFERISMEEAVAELHAEKTLEDKVVGLRRTWCAGPAASEAVRPLSGRLRVTVNGVSYDVTCEEIR
jgi:antagonist of KipI